MGLLNGGISAIFGSALSGLYLDGVLHRDGAEPVYDGEGNITGYAGGDPLPCKVQIDGVTWAQRQAEGYSDGDVRIIVLAAGLGVDVTTDHRLSARGAEWMIASVDQDAAASHWICRGRKA